MVLVDSTVWSLALRRKPGDLSQTEQELVDEWIQLVSEDCATLVGLCKQEILSGIRRKDQFERLEIALSDFPSLAVDDADYIEAAKYYNLCCEKGVAGTPIDLLICAVAARLGMPILTADQDFHRYAKHLPILLHEATA